MCESPRYLVKKGKRDRALQLLADLHANGDITDQLVFYECEEIVLAVELDVDAASSSYFDFFRTRGGRKRLMLVLWFAWATSMSGVGCLRFPLSCVADTEPP